MKYSLRSTTGILFLSVAILMVVASVAGWMSWTLQAELDDRTTTLAAMRTASRDIAELTTAQENQAAMIVSAKELESRIRNALIQSDIPATAVLQILVSDEVTVPGIHFKRRDTRIRLSFVTLEQLSKAYENLRAACPAADFAEAEMEAGPAARQSEPERWNSSLLLSEFRYSAD